MSWRQFVMNLRDLEAAVVEGVLDRHGALAVTYSDAADDPVLEPLPGETPLWQDTCITGLFDETTDFGPLRDDLKQSLGLEELPPSRIEVLEDREWAREWLKDFRAMKFGNNLWVCPVGTDAPERPATVIHLDPGLAFGTGSHPTTALCLEALSEMDVTEKQVLDFGCGSGILAIGALLLGARETMAYDIDPQAVSATLKNAAQNGVDGRLAASDDPTDVHADYDIVLANILARPLIELTRNIAGRLKPGGTLVLSGILAEQCDAVAEAYRNYVKFDEPRLRDGWACLTGTRL
jgi:ribosomal protein L11 methyltransferase